MFKIVAKVGKVVAGNIQVTCEPKQTCIETERDRQRAKAVIYHPKAMKQIDSKKITKKIIGDQIEIAIPFQARQAAKTKGKKVRNRLGVVNGGDQVPKTRAGELQMALEIVDKISEVNEATIKEKRRKEHQQLHIRKQKQDKRKERKELGEKKRKSQLAALRNQ